jgi:hypothetical protein
MDWKTFVIRMMSILLSWPVVTVVLALVFQGAIRELLSRVKRLKAWSAEAEMTDALLEAAEQVADSSGLPPASPEPPPVGARPAAENGGERGGRARDDIHGLVSHAVRRSIRLLRYARDTAQRQPGAAILSAFAVVAECLEELLAENGIAAEGGRARDHDRWLVQQAQVHGVLSEEETTLFSSLELLHRFAKAGAPVDPGQAYEYIALAQRLLMGIELRRDAAEPVGDGQTAIPD